MLKSGQKLVHWAMIGQCRLTKNGVINFLSVMRNPLGFQWICSSVDGRGMLATEAKIAVAVMVSLMHRSLRKIDVSLSLLSLVQHQICVDPVQARSLNTGNKFDRWGTTWITISVVARDCPTIALSSSAGRGASKLNLGVEGMRRGQRPWEARKGSLKIRE